jgi:hypothetical protein
MEGFGQFIVPLLIMIFAIVKVVSAAKKAGEQPQQPVRRQTPPPVRRSSPPSSRNDWEDLLEALGQKKDTNDEGTGHPLEPSHRRILDFPTEEPVINAPPPLPPVVNAPAPEPKFVRVSDYSSRPLDQIDRRETESERDLAKKFSALEGSVATVERQEAAVTQRPAEHPIHARFRDRKSIRDAIVMSEVLGSPLALRQ